MTKHTKRRRSKKRRPGFFQKYRALLILLGFTGLAIVSLVVLARIEEEPKAPPIPVAKPSPVDHTPRVHAEVEAFLAMLGQDNATIQRDLDQTPARYTVVGEFPAQEMISGFQTRLEGIAGDFRVRYRQANSLTVEKSRQIQVVVHFSPAVPLVPAGPLLTIIMDDLGRSTYAAEVLTSLAQQVTFAILPEEPHAVQVAELAHAAGHEVMLHVPMEPQGYPAVNPGSGALFVKYDEADIRRRFEQFLAKVPHVTGANNHMGSRFTEDVRALTPVMESSREKGLFFVDSRTTGHSRVSEVAQSYGVPTMSRDVFLDNVADVDAIIREIRRLEGKARRQGTAIGICHPYPETLKALQSELPKLAERGIKVVPVAVLLRKQAQGS